MKAKTLFLILLIAGSMQAKNNAVRQRGSIVLMNAVQCGYDQKSGKSFAGELLGTDSAHKKTVELLCPEYVLQGERITYHIRPIDSKHPTILPLGARVLFRADKDKLKLRVEDLDDKERAYSVVSMTQRDEKEVTATSIPKSAKTGD